MIVRGSELSSSMSEYLVTEIRKTANIDVRTGTEVIDGGGRGGLEMLHCGTVRAARPRSCRHPRDRGRTPHPVAQRAVCDGTTAGSFSLGESCTSANHRS